MSRAYCRCDFAVMIVFASVAISAAPCLAQLSVDRQSGQPPQSADDDAKEIKRRLAELDDERFYVREAASRRLAEIGAAAIPFLREAALSGSMETSVRSIAVMRSIAAQNDAASQAVRQSLQSLAEPGYTFVGTHASRALLELRVVDEERARAFLLSKGANYGTGQNTGRGVQTPTHLEFTQRWTGDADDFSRIRNVRKLQLVTLVGPGFTDDVLPNLLALDDGVAELQLYATKLSQQAIEQLRASFPGALDIRIGGKLGVLGNIGELKCVIDEVTAGSAAARAGIRAGDIIVSCNGRNISTFNQLTDAISEKAPGDWLEIEVLRSTGKVRVRAQLDSW